MQEGTQYDSWRLNRRDSTEEYAINGLEEETSDSGDSQRQGTHLTDGVSLHPPPTSTFVLSHPSSPPHPMRPTLLSLKGSKCLNLLDSSTSSFTTSPDTRHKRKHTHVWGAKTYTHTCVETESTQRRMNKDQSNKRHTHARSTVLVLMRCTFSVLTLNAFQKFESHDSAIYSGSELLQVPHTIIRPRDWHTLPVGSHTAHSRSTHPKERDC